VSKTKTVGEWLREMQNYEIIVDEGSYNLEMELANYVWSDKRAGDPMDGFNHCFIGNTSILTDKGLIFIKDIVEGDLVATSNGYNKVLKKFNNGKKQVNKYVIQSDMFSLSLSCTEDHKIKTDEGWIPISQLKSGNQVYLNKNFMVKYIDCILNKNIFPEQLIGCTLSYGNSIMAGYRKPILYTIRTKIRGIIGLKTLKYKNVNNTTHYTVKNELLKIKSGLLLFKRRVLLRLLNGIVQKMEDYGTQIMVKNHGLIGSIKRSFVKFAVKNIEQGMEENLNTVTITVKQLHVEEGCKQQVYDLMVENEHEYYANGLLVHNCIDAMRYYFMYKMKKIRRNW
jgi:intein/homing endonuclease